MRPTKRDELVRKALEIFYRDGFHATGMDKLVAETGISKTTMFKHFRTKEDLILAALRLRDELLRDWFFRRLRESADTAQGRLDALFDVLAEWFDQPTFRGCLFMKASAEFQEPDHPIHSQSAEHKRLMWLEMRELADQAGYAEPDRVADQLSLLVEGATITAQISGPAGVIAAAKPAASSVMLAAKRSPGAKAPGPKILRCRF